MNIESIVNNGLCTGCGVCISEDDTKQSKMVWSKEGFYIPKLGQNSTQEKMVKVCPFFKNQKNEDYLGEEFLKSDITLYDGKLGFYLNFYAGYSKKYRKTSSSGGLATYIFKSLLENEIVDHLFVVKEKDGEYSYQFFSNVDDITKISKTRYIPVTLENLFTSINEVDGKVAVSGVACFVKAIRLKQHQCPELKEKIPFIVGIICGGLKSKFYTDYLAQSSGCLNEYSSVEYRVKNELSSANNYSFSCIDKKSKRIHMIEMRQLGDMWGTGLFKSRACDFCDDVVTELADVSLGDAWLEPYNKDGLGNSIVITRSLLAERLIHTGIDNQELVLNVLDKETVLRSQQGSFNHRHNGLYYRIDKLKQTKIFPPSKRERHILEQNFIFNKVQALRLIIRENSLKVWNEKKDLNFFNGYLKNDIKKLRIYSKMNRMLINLINLWKRK